MKKVLFLVLCSLMYLTFSTACSAYKGTIFDTEATIKDASGATWKWTDYTFKNSPVVKSQTKTETETITVYYKYGENSKRLLIFLCKKYTASLSRIIGAMTVQGMRLQAEAR